MIALEELLLRERNKAAMSRGQEILDRLRETLDESRKDAVLNWGRVTSQAALVANMELSGGAEYAAAAMGELRSMYGAQAKLENTCTEIENKIRDLGARIISAAAAVGEARART